MLAPQSDMVFYTDDVPVITQELLASFKKSVRFATDAAYRSSIEKISLSQSDDVFKHSDEDLYGPDSDNDDVRVWRQGVSDSVQEFVACALYLLGDTAADHLPANLYLNEAGKLTAIDGREITTQNIAARYIDAGVDRDLCMAFADYYTRTFASILGHFPADYCLENAATSVNFCYASEIEGAPDKHYDSYNQALINLSDPGTPYWTDQESQIPAYRTQAGDVTIHGKWAYHAVATSASLPNGLLRPRFFMAYQILPATNW